MNTTKKFARRVRSKKKKMFGLCSSFMGYFAIMRRTGNCNLLCNIHNYIPECIYNYVEMK